MTDSQTLTESTVLSNLEFAPKCESVIILVATGEKVTCDHVATHVLTFHRSKDCTTITDLECQDCVEESKALHCRTCGKDAYISSMPIKVEDR